MAISASLPYTNTSFTMTGSPVEVPVPSSKDGWGILRMVSLRSSTQFSLLDSGSNPMPIPANTPHFIDDPNLGGKTIGLLADSGTVYVTFWFGSGR